jgi:hypothetical protein
LELQINKRVPTIIIFDITKFIIINSENSDLDNFLVSTRSYQSEITKFTDVIKNIDKYFIPYIDKIYTIFSITNVKEIGIICQTTWLDDSISGERKEKNQIAVLKRFKNLQYAEKYF